MTVSERHFFDQSGEVEPHDRLWTREEYDRLIELGFFDGERGELIEGRIIRLSPRRVAHSVAVELVNRYMSRAFGTGHGVRSQLPFRSADGSEPEPYFAIIVGDDPRASTEHASTAVLIVEISDTTLEHDRRKARLYAASGVPEYWILNPISRTLEVHRKPGSREGVAAYSETKTLKDREVISPLTANLEISVAELLP